MKKYFIPLFLSLSFSINAIAAETLTLRDKIGQMLLMGFDGKTVNADSRIIKNIEKNTIGGVILFDFNSSTNTFDKNIESPKQVQKLTHDLQEFNQKANLKYHRPQLPLLISVDYEGGIITRLDQKYGFPATKSAAEIGDLGMHAANENAELMANTLKENGFNLDFAPVLDVNVNPDNPVIAQKQRSFSSVPAMVELYAYIYTQHFLSQNIQCAYKHFPGHGSSTKDSHLDFVDVSNTWHDYEMQPYQNLLATNQACGMIMTAHIVNRQLDPTGLPATLSHTILTDVLRNQLHFDGVIITDDMQMKAISDHYGLEQALVLAINAGADMFIFGNNLALPPQDPEKLIDIIEAKVHSGEISAERIDDAYKHISAFKQTLVRK